jgi:uncharacterized protein YhaN
VRFRALSLDRFGRFTGRGLDLSAPRGLHVVCGPNEAGKSTVLAAVCDLLFGIETRSPYNFLHDYSELRIGAEVEARDGRRLRFWRRKGRLNTLLAEDGSSLPDDALRQFMGAHVDRGLFQGLFGLDHGRLRQGGNDILQARGEIGRMLFEAGSGLTGLGGVLKSLDEEANALFTPRRVASKPFYQALDRFTAARRRQRETAVGTEEWRTLRARLDEAEARLAENRDAMNRVETARARAERRRRVLRSAALLRDVEARLAALAGVVDLPEAAAAEREEALRRIESAGAAHARCTAVADALEAELAAVTVAEPVLVEAQRIQAVYEQRAVIREQQADLPKRETELRHLGEQVAALLRGLGMTLPPERAGELIPSKPVLGEVRALIVDEGRLRERIAAAEDQLVKAQVEQRRLAALLDRAAGSVDPLDLMSTVAALRARGDLDRMHAEAAAEAERLSGHVARLCAALPLWHGDAAGLGSARTPDGHTVARFDDLFSELQDRAGRLRERRDAAREELAGVERDIAAIMRGGDVPDAEAVAAARRRRDEEWCRIRACWQDGGRPGDAELAGFEEAVRAADHVADRKDAEAQRVARYVGLVARRDELTCRLAALEGEASACIAERAAVEADWRAAWRPAGIEPASPREMSGWLARRDEILREHEAASAAADRAGRLAREIAEARRRLAASIARHGRSEGGGQESGGVEEGTLGLLLRRAELLAERLAKDAAERRALETRSAEHAAELDRVRRQLELARAAELQWQARWRAATAPLGCREDVGTAAVEAMLATIEDLDRRLVQRDEIGHRVARMRENVAAFAAEVSALGRDVGIALDGTDPVHAAADLFALLGRARQDADRRADLARRLREARSEADSAARELERARETHARLLRLAGVGDDAALTEALALSRERRDLQARRREAERALLEAGDGLSLTELLDEVEGVDPDGLVAELAALRDEAERLHVRSAELGAAREALVRELVELERGRGAGEAAQDAQQAAAELRDVAERFARVRAAGLLLRRAVERFREEQQGPLLGRAGDLFRMLTLGAFEALKVDYDDRDQPVLKGQRAGGVLVPAEGMSDGTRDQLYLALRLAAVERYVREAEPLPFVADDLFVHFDDERAAAAFAALGQLGRETQVIFFTHHPHLCSVAERRLGSDGFAVHHLDRG